jgi:hypothetical protein
LAHKEKQGKQEIPDQLVTLGQLVILDLLVCKVRLVKRETLDPLDQWETPGLLEYREKQGKLVRLVPQDRLAQWGLKDYLVKLVQQVQSLWIV